MAFGMTRAGGDSMRIGEWSFNRRDIVPEDQSEVLALHNRVFGANATAAWFRWKYGDGGAQATGLWDERGRLLALCGGTPRTLLHAGQAVAAIQLGDVMVAPEVRGLLTRRGPFFQVSRHFYESRIGAGRPFQVGFGFASKRHVRLAIALRLAWNEGTLQSIQWSDLAGNSPWGWRCEPLEPASFERAATEAWQAMQEGLTGLSAGCRDVHYLQHRFLARPGYAYRLFRIRRSWSRRTSGILVLRLQGETAHWLDWIGPPEEIGLAARIAQIQAAAAGARVMTLWASSEICESLKVSLSEESTVAWVGIPGVSTLLEEDAGRRKWWWMGGDTDFL